MGDEKTGQSATEAEEEFLSKLQDKYGKVGVVHFEGHRIVFRRPTRTEVRDYRRKEDQPAEKYDRLDSLAQFTIVAFDDEVDVVKARMIFTNSFLESYPMATDSVKFQTVLLLLAGGQEEEHATFLGKGCSVMSATTSDSRKG
jgi:hypothetical protein